MGERGSENVNPSLLVAEAGFLSDTHDSLQYVLNQPLWTSGTLLTQNHTKNLQYHLLNISRHVKVKRQPRK